MSRERMFDRIIGVDYSGARAPTNRLDGLAVCCADGNDPFYRVLAPGDRSDNRNRKELADWLVDWLCVSFQVHLLILHGAPQPLHEDVVEAASLSVHADLHPVFLQRLDELPAGELATPVGVKTWGWPCPSASFKASTQKSASRVLDNRRAATYRLCQSMMATR